MSVKQQTIIGGKTITVYPACASGRPIVYFNTFVNEDEKVLHILREQNCPDFTLVTVCGLDWDHDLSPWKAPAVFPGDADFRGEADHFLDILMEKIIPQSEKEVDGNILWRGIAGYSLAGLFAIYSLYKTDVFSRAASMSGSLWFPNFKEYALSHKMQRLPECVYFSLGDKESKTRNPYLKTVQSDTEKIVTSFRSRGIAAEFELNPGNHYKDITVRSAAGIRWILEK